MHTIIIAKKLNHQLTILDPKPSLLYIERNAPIFSRRASTEFFAHVNSVSNKMDIDRDKELATPKADAAVTSATPAPELEPPRITIFDEDGDLRLEVGAESSRKHTTKHKDQKKNPMQIFVVCSKALRRVSKPFRTMLYGPFAESKHRQSDPTSIWTVKLPEDDPKAFNILLNIIHNKFELVPGSMGRDDLFHVTVLTNKYDITDIIQPWAKTWIKPLADAKLDDQCFDKGDECYLWIAWELGYEDLFTCVLEWMQNVCTKDSSGNLRILSDTVLQDNPYIVSLGVVGKLLVTSTTETGTVLICFANTKTISPLSMPVLSLKS